MKKIIPIIIILLVVVISLIVFFGKDNIEQNLTAEEIANKIKEKNSNVGRIVVYDEKTDINELLGRPNQYTSKATFEDLRIEQINKNLDKEYFSEEEINEPIGGTIEVFKNEKDMKKRKKYIEEITSSISVFAEYSYGEKVYLLRLNNSLTPSQAEEYKNIFYEIVK